MTVAVGLVGAGRIAWTHAEVLYEREDAALEVVCDLEREKANRLASEVGAEGYRDYRTALREADLDVVYVTTPPGTRADVVREAARNDIAVFCEKPLAITVNEGRAIARIVEEHDLPFMMGFPTRFSEPCQRLSEILASGRIGEPVTVFSMRAGHGSPEKGDWRIDPEQACGVTIESTSHNIDTVRWLGGEIGSVAGRTANVTHPEIDSFDDNTLATMGFERGAIGFVQNSWTSRVEYLRHGVIGTQGSVIVEGDEWWRLDRLTHATDADAYPTTITFDAETATEMGYAGETEAFLRSVVTGDDPPTSVRDGLRALEISHEIIAH